MDKKKRIILISIVIALLVSIVGAFTYAWWILTKTQEDTNVLIGKCFKLEYDDVTDALNLDGEVPVTNVEGLSKEQYEFKITNECEEDLYYMIALEDTTIDNEINTYSVKVGFDGELIGKYHTLADMKNKVNDNANASKRIYRGWLAGDSSEEHYINLWIDSTSTVEDAGKSFAAKIAIVTGQDIKDDSERMIIANPLGKIDKDVVSQIITLDEIPSNMPSDATDISVAQNGSAYMWMEANEDAVNDTTDKIYYTLYLASDGKVVVNTNGRGTFAGFVKCYKIDVSNLDTSYTKYMQSFFSQLGRSTGFGSDKYISIIGLETLDTSNVIQMGGLFMATCLDSNKSIKLNVTNWNTSKVTNMAQIFSNVCQNKSAESSIEIIGLDNWDVSNVSLMNSIFYDLGVKAKYVDVGDLSKWDTSGVISMSGIFGNFGNNANFVRTGDISNWDVSNVSSFVGMFSGSFHNPNLDAKSILGDLSKWDTGSATDMRQMFDGFGPNGTKIYDLSNWDVSNVSYPDYLYFGDNVIPPIWNN